MVDKGAGAAGGARRQLLSFAGSSQLTHIFFSCDVILIKTLAMTSLERMAEMGKIFRVHTPFGSGVWCARPDF